jgi:hypothetical protein
LAYGGGDNSTNSSANNSSANNASANNASANNASANNASANKKSNEGANGTSYSRAHHARTNGRPDEVADEDSHGTSDADSDMSHTWANSKNSHTWANR